MSERIRAPKAMRQAPHAPAAQSGQFAALIFAGALAMLPGTALAQDTTWSGATSGDLSDPGNWAGGVVPTGVASFGASSQTALSSSSLGILLMRGWTFEAGAPNYTYDVAVPTYLQGVGIVNNGSGTVTLNNSSSNLNFTQAATAGNAVIDNSGNGLVSFDTGASAGTATLNNLANTASIDFSNGSHLGQAAILNDGTLRILGSHAENASITNNGIIDFGGAATGDDATIENNTGGVVNFAGTSTGGNAVITNNTGALVDFSASTGPNGDNKLSIGNIIGDGDVYLGGNALSIGGSQDIILSGVLSDCGASGNDCQNAGATGGSLVKTGTGALTIANADTYTGGTTVSAGKLQIGNATTAGNIVGGVNVASGATFSVVNGSGYLSASQINNSGVTEFHGNAMPAYAVITNAAGGVVDFSDDRGFAGDGQISVKGLAGAGNFYLGSNTLTLRGSGVNTTVSGVISDCGAGGTACNTPGATSGALVVNISALTLTGANTYTGGTTVNGGSLFLGDATSRGSIVGNVTVGAAGALQLVNTDLSGVGTLDNAGVAYFKNGTNADGIALNNSGTVYFSGNSTAGNAAITNNAGGLVDFSASSGPNGDHRLSAGSIAGAGNFVLGANALTVGGDNSSTTVDGVISGTGGSLVKTGSGTLTLSGANTYTGATTVSAGTLRAGAADAFGGNGAATVNAGATLDLNDYSQNIGSLAGAGNVALGSGGATVLAIGGDNTSTRFSGVVSGGGGLNKGGTGTLILNGVNTYTGATTVAGGVLEVGDIHTPTASIASNVTVDAAGTLRGHGTVIGDVANNGTVFPGGSIGTLTVNGNYTQAGTATLAIEVGPTGASKLVVNGNAALAGTLAISYDPGTYTTKTYTLVQANSISGAFASTTETGKADGLASAINTTGTTVDLALTGSNIIAPTQTGIYSALGSSVLSGAQSANTTLLDRLGAAPASGFSVDPWVMLTGSDTKVGSTGSTPGFESQRYGFLGGHDKTLDDGTALGFAFGYDHGQLSQSGEASSGKTDTVRVAAYGSRAAGPVNLSATVGVGLDWLKQGRRFAGGTAQGDHMGQEATAGVQAALPLHFNAAATLTPKLGLRYTYFHGNAFTESGAGGQDLGVGSDNAQSLQPYVGLALDLNFGNGSQGKPAATVQARVGYAYEALDTHRGLSVVAQDGTPFDVGGAALPRSYLTAGLGVTLHATKNLDVSLNYDALINTNHTSSQRGSLNVVYRF